MRTSTLARWHPFLILGIVTYVLVILPGMMGWDYDEHLLATAVFVAGQMLGLIFHLLDAAFVAVNGGIVMPYQTPLVSILGLGMYGAADIALTRYAKRRLQ